MTPDDRKTFAQMMAQFFAVYQADLTPKTLDIWWGILFDCELQDVREAMNAHVADPDAGMFTPRPAHIVNRMEHAKKLKAAAVRALRDEMQERIRVHDDAIYQANNDYRLSLISEATAAARAEEARSAIRNIRRMPEYKLVWEQQRLEKQ